MKLNILLVRILGGILSACRTALSCPMSVAGLVAFRVGGKLNRDENREYERYTGWAQRLGGRTQTQLVLL